MKNIYKNYFISLTKAKTIVILLVFFCSFLRTNYSYGQVAGDYGAFQTGTWNTAANWKIYDGVSWASSPVAGSSPGNPAINVFILPGVTVTLTLSSTPCKNLTINATGKLYANTMVSNVYVNVYGDIVCDGTIGNGAIFDGISFNIEGTNCLFTGTGIVDCSRVRKNLTGNPTTNLVFDINANLRWNTASQTQIYNNAANTVFNVTVNAGKILSLPAVGGFTGNASMDGLSGSNGIESGGSYTINGTLIISGTLFITTDNATSPCNFTIGPTGIVQTANLIANSSGAATHSLTMFTGGLLQITGTPFTNPFMLVNNNYSLAPGSTIEYSALGVQDVDSNLTYANLKISGSGNKTAAGPIDANGNITITNATGAAVFVPYAAWPTVNLGGDWTNYNTSGFSETASTVTFNGSGNQNITCSAGEDFSTLKINKSGGKVYLASVPATIARVINQLNLTSGNIVTSAYNGNYYVQIQNTANVVNVSNSSFVEGACARQLIATSLVNFTFPVGKIAKYRPEGILGTPSVSSIIIGEYFKVDPNTVGNVNLHDATLNHVSRCEYWRLRLIGTVTPQLFTVTLSWDTYSACNYGVTFLPDMRVASWNSPLVNTWNNMGNSGTTGNITTGTVTASIQSSFVSSASGTPFTLASATLENPLPIKLLSFTATNVNEMVKLNWTTGSEINNDYFTIERSRDGIEFKEIDRVRGAGNSTDLKNYEDVDASPFAGISYYRLRQTDYDGNYTFSDAVIVQIKGNTDLNVYAFPVPATDVLNVYLSGSNESYTVQLVQPDGRLIKAFSEKSSTLKIDLGDLHPGLYFLTVYGENNKKTIPVIKK